MLRHCFSLGRTVCLPGRFRTQEMEVGEVQDIWGEKKGLIHARSQEMHK